MVVSNQKNLWILCGIPGIGKSTFIKNHINNFCGKSKVISRDAIRFSLLKEGEAYFSHENEVWNKFVTDTRDSLLSNDNTILDATHLNQSSRCKILRALGKTLKGIKVNAIVLDGSLELALERNETREGLSKVPEQAIINMYNSMTYPDKKEGFDTIIIIKQGEDCNEYIYYE